MGFFFSFFLGGGGGGGFVHTNAVKTPKSF